jgi:hypothetical protein
MLLTSKYETWKTTPENRHTVVEIDGRTALHIHNRGWSHEGLDLPYEDIRIHGGGKYNVSAEFLPTGSTSMNHFGKNVPMQLMAVFAKESMYNVKYRDRTYRNAAFTSEDAATGEWVQLEAELDLTGVENATGILRLQTVNGKPSFGDFYIGSLQVEDTGNSEIVYRLEFSLEDNEDVPEPDWD